MTFPVLVVLLVAMRRALPQFSSIIAAMIDLNKWRHGLEVLEEINQKENSERQGTVSPPAKVDEIQFKDVSFFYETKPDTNVLQNINLSLKKNTISAFVGSTGAGKSTIANLLIGLFDVRSGSILINGIDFRKMRLDEWRKKVGYVTQDIYLFNSSLKDNIALWDDTVTQGEVEKAAQLAQLDDFVKTMPEGYDTIVGDRGLRLSGGQCQRVAIARAILKKPEVIIFDEATSALDNLTEKAVYEAIHSLRQDSIVIVISHRLSTINEVDQILVLRNGKVVERGGHEELLESKGYYAELYKGDKVLSSQVQEVAQ